MVSVLGIDPGFASIGYARVLFDGERLEVERMGVFRTEKSSNKRKVFASDDNMRRAREIHTFLCDLLREGPHGPVRAVCAETMSFPRSSSVAAKMAMCWGVLAGLSQQFDVPILQASPMELKNKVAGSKKASKEEVQAALEKRFGKSKLQKLCADVPASFFEHPYDALGAVVACSDSEVIRLARRMSTEARAS
jgi:crossover junction endodeoxyribonuclease RuvC